MEIAPVVKGLSHRLYTARSRVRSPAGVILKIYRKNMCNVPERLKGLNLRSTGLDYRGFEPHSVQFRIILCLFLGRGTHSSVVERWSYGTAKVQDSHGSRVRAPLCAIYCRSRSIIKTVCWSGITTVITSDFLQ